MSIFKCKICGGSLEYKEGSSVALCEYCGTKQTLPKLAGEHNSTLYERAEHFRRSNDFDKAINIYEQILNNDNTDAEAYWSLVLCRYGVEYVEDPKSNQRIATVNRMQYTSVLADEDYKSAIKYATGEQREIYEAEAREIDGIQKGILAISQKEEPFDVFICYKETDNNGRRTPDSVLANELYHQLDNEGYKVFFSRITLEDKLGSAYEPYIFAALNSAKVMVVIGTKPEYFNAVWVRNEWSRFLSLIKNGANKVLIPAYRDMDPYNLPEEFSHLQAQDMSKLGFMQDLIRGIEKLTKASKPKYVKETVVQNASNTTSLINRVFLFLEDGDFESANEYCEKVLDIDAFCGEAYLGKMMIDLKVRRREKLSEQAQPFDNNTNYKKALRFGDDKLKAELEGYTNTIIQRIEYDKLLEIYKKAEFFLANAKTEENFKEAAKAFEFLGDFKDAKEKVKECQEKAYEAHYSGTYNSALALMKSAKTEEEFIKAKQGFDAILEYKNSKELAEECAKKADSINKNGIYATAVALMTGNKARNYKKAIVEFEKIRGYKDVDQKIEYCNKKIEQINEAIKVAGFERQAKAQERAEALREKSEAFKEKIPLIKKVALIVVPILVVAIVAVTVIPKIDWSKPTTSDNLDATISNTIINGTESTDSTVSDGLSSGVSSSATTNKPGNSNPGSYNPPLTPPSDGGAVAITTHSDGCPFKNGAHSSVLSKIKGTLYGCYVFDNSVVHDYEVSNSGNNQVVKTYVYDFNAKLKQENVLYYSSGVITRTTTTRYLNEDDRYTLAARPGIGVVVEKEEYRYDSKGNPSTGSKQGYSADGKLYFKEEYKYSSKVQGNPANTTQYIYNKNGKLVEKREWSLNSSGYMESAVVYRYDRYNIVSTKPYEKYEVKYDSNSDIKTYKQYLYDGAGNLVYQINGEPSQKNYLKTYDSKGNLLISAENCGEGLILFYDNAGNEIFTANQIFGNVAGLKKQIYESYYSNGKVATQLIADRKKLKFIFYEYDSAGKLLFTVEKIEGSDAIVYDANGNVLQKVSSNSEMYIIHSS